VAVSRDRLALATDKLTGAMDEVSMLRDELSSRESALTLVNAELVKVRRYTEQLTTNYQTALQKYDTEQSDDHLLQQHIAWEHSL